jgi:hypothetical protein
MTRMCIFIEVSLSRAAIMRMRRNRGIAENRDPGAGRA